MSVFAFEQSYSTKNVIVLFKYIVFFKSIFLYFKKSYVSVSRPKYAYLGVFY